MTRTQKLSWLLAATAFAALTAFGFQTKTEKYGVVNVERVFNESDFTKKQNENLRQVGETRTGILDFLSSYRVLTTEQATRFKDLSLKAQRTPAEQAELEKIKTDGQAAEGAFKALQTKASPSPAEVTQLQDYNNRAQTMASLSQRWAREFDDEVRTLNENLRGQTMDKVRTAIKEVGAKGGYTVMFTQEIAPYGANDVTDETLKAMNAQK